MIAQAHGGLTADELAGGPVLDFSASLNRRGPAPEVLAAIRAADPVEYPDPRATPARRAIGRRFGVPDDAVLVGPGAVELLWSAARALLGPGRTTLVVEPAFGEWTAAARRTGARVVPWRAPLARGVDVDAIAAAARACGAAAVYLAEPANPGGRAAGHDAVAALARALAPATLVLDEAFLSLSTRAADADRPLPGAVLRIRSLTKDHGLAGVRVGYALAPPALCARVDAERPPWSTSAAAIAAATAAVSPGAEAFVAASRAALLAERDRLAAGLAALGAAPPPSDTIYVLAEVGGATALRARLLARHRIAVRDATSFGLPDHVRVCARPVDEIDRLLAALAEELPCPPPR